jgi:putative DNA primase/helicase
MTDLATELAARNRQDDNLVTDLRIVEMDRRREQASPPIQSFNAYEFINKDLPPRELMLAPWLTVQGLTLVAAPRGVGKTHIAVGVAYAVASGGEFLRWKAPRPRKVLLLDGEMPGSLLQNRVREEMYRAGEIRDAFTWDNLRIAPADLQERGLPDLTLPEAQALYAPLLQDRDLIVVDNLSTICRGLKENDADSWTSVQDWALTQRRNGKSVLFIHHCGKSGQQRGTSRKEDVLDTVLTLRRPPDFSPEQGARFEVRFDKSRGFHGLEAEPFEARLSGGKWSTSEIRAADDLESLLALKAAGYSVREIAERTGLSKSTVARKLGEAA